MRLELPAEASRTALGRVASWMLERYVEGELSVDEAADPRWFYPTDNVEERLRLFGVFRRPISRVLAYEEVDGLIARFSVVDDRGRPLLVRVQQHPDHPGRVWTSSMMLDPPDVEVGSATKVDGEALRALELATPVVHEGSSISYDRPDPFAEDRLRPLPVFRLVAKVGGRIVGMHADACHVLHADAGPVPVVYRHHSRVHPDVQGTGVMPAMNGYQSELIRRDGVDRKVLLYIAAGNVKIAAYASGGSGGQHELEWTTPIVRVSLNCHDRPRHAAATVGAPSDGPGVAELFEMTFGRSVFWPRGGESWLSARMSQSPDDYSWKNVLTNAHACVGVWDAGWNVIRRDGHGHTVTRVATILDWAFDPDHPEALEDCLAAACLTASRAGIDRLFAYYGPQVPGTEVFEMLGDDFERFKINTPIAEPVDAAERGIYVDPIYF